jgi:hypothetical protein
MHLFAIICIETVQDQIGVRFSELYQGILGLLVRRWGLSCTRYLLKDVVSNIHSRVVWREGGTPDYIAIRKLVLGLIDGK